MPERGTHWCHDCKESVSTAEEFKCSKCNGLFIEEMDNSAQSFIVPQYDEKNLAGEVLSGNGLPSGL